MIIIPWLNQVVNPNDQSTGVCAYVYIYILIGSCLDDFPIRKKGGISLPYLITRDESACSTIFHIQNLYTVPCRQAVTVPSWNVETTYGSPIDSSKWES